MEWWKLVPTFITAATAVATLTIAYPLSARRKHQRHLDRLLATLDKMPTDDARFTPVRLKLQTEASNAAARVAAGIHIGIPIGDYLWCACALVVMSIGTWANTELDPTLSPGFSQRFNQILTWGILALVPFFIRGRLLVGIALKREITFMYRRRGAELHVKTLRQTGIPAPTQRSQTSL